MTSCTGVISTEARHSIAAQTINRRAPPNWALRPGDASATTRPSSFGVSSKPRLTAKSATTACVFPADSVSVGQTAAPQTTSASQRGGAR
jgi:hypothetical protein